MEKYILAFAISLLCTTSAPAQLILGRFEGQPPADKVYLYAYDDLMGYGERIIDSAKVISGHFRFDFTLGKEPRFAELTQLRPKEGKKGWDFLGSVQLFLANDTISVIAQDSLTNARVYNSVINYDYQALQQLTGPIQKRLQVMVRKMSADQMVVPEAIRTSRQYQRYAGKLMELAEKELLEAYDSFINSFPHSWISLYVLTLRERAGLNQSAKPQKLLELYSGLNNRLKSSGRGQDFRKRMDRLISLQPGTDAPVFSLPNAEGKQIGLADYKGKYVLLEFWTVSCAPCRAEAPHLLEAYKKYHNKGFEILSVSLDDARYTREQSWLAAIKKDGSGIWQHVSDFKGMESPAALLYGIRAFPQNFLIDPEGRILSENLRGADLHEKLDEIFRY